MSGHSRHLPADERRAATVEAVVDLAAEQNPSDITTTAIAQRMGLTQGALFRHFPTRVCSQSSQPDEGTSQMDERQEGFGEFVVARGDTSELLDAAEETLDQIAALVDMPVERARVESIGTWRDDCLAALCGNCFDKGIRVVALVGHDEIGGLILNQCGGLLDVGDLPGGENDPQRIPQGIHRDMQFGRQSAPRTADFLLAGFFWAPAECW